MANDKLYYNYKKLEKESINNKTDNSSNITYIHKFKISLYCFAAAFISGTAMAI